VFQECRANAALVLLRQRLALNVRVKRDGVWGDMAAADLVPHDIVRLSLGNLAPADLRIVRGALLVDHSMLTGESIPVEREPGEGVYAGGLVRRGEAIAEVVATSTGVMDSGFGAAAPPRNVGVGLRDFP
jgi:H+-transporting ATPase